MQAVRKVSCICWWGCVVQAVRKVSCCELTQTEWQLIRQLAKLDTEDFRCCIRSQIGMFYSIINHTHKLLVDHFQAASSGRKMELCSGHSTRTKETDSGWVYR